MNQLLRDVFTVFHQPYLKLLSFSCANTLILSQYPQISNSFQVQIPESYVNNIGVKLKSCLILSTMKSSKSSLFKLQCWDRRRTHASIPKGTRRQGKIWISSKPKIQLGKQQCFVVVPVWCRISYSPGWSWTVYVVKIKYCLR